MKKYYVIYKSKDVGWYQTEHIVICVVLDEEVAKDFCRRFTASYVEMVVGEKGLPFNKLKV